MQEFRPFFKVTIISSQGVKKHLVEGGGFSVGRSNESDIILPFQGVSRKHFSVRAHDGEIVIEDHKSTYGTFVEGKKLPDKPVRYDPTTSIQLGELNIYIIVRLHSPIEVIHMSQAQSKEYSERIVQPETDGDVNQWLQKKLNWSGKNDVKLLLSDHFKKLENDFENNVGKLLLDAEKVKKEIEKSGRTDARLVIETAHKVALGLENEANLKAEEKYKEIVKEVEGYVKSKKKVADELLTKAEKHKDKVLVELQKYVETEKEKIQRELASAESKREKIVQKAQEQASDVLLFAEKESEIKTKELQDNIKKMHLKAETDKERIINEGLQSAAEITAQAEKKAADIIAKQKAQSLLEVEKLVSEQEAKGKEIIQNCKIKAEVEAERIKAEGENYRENQVKSGDEYYTEKKDKGDLYHFKKVKEGEEYFEKKKSQGDAYYLLKTEDADNILREKTREADLVIESANSKAENLVNEANAERKKILNAIETEKGKYLEELKMDKEQLEMAKVTIEKDIDRLKAEAAEQEKILKLDWKKHSEDIEKLRNQAELKGRMLVERYNKEGQQNFKEINKKLKQELKSKIREIRRLEHEFRRKIKKQSTYFYAQETRLKQEVLSFKNNEIKDFIKFLSGYKKKIHGDLEAKVNDLTHNVESLEKKRASLNSTIEELTQKQSELFEEKTNLLKQKSHLENDLKELNETIQKLNAEHEESIQDYEKQKKQIAKDVKALNEELFEKQKEMRTGEIEWEKEKENLIKRVKELEKQLHKYHSNLSSDKEYIEDIQRQFTKEKAALQFEIEKNLNLIDTLKQEGDFAIQKIKLEYEEKLKAEKRKNNSEGNSQNMGAILKIFSSSNKKQAFPPIDVTSPSSVDIEDNITERIYLEGPDNEEYATTKSGPVELFEQTKKERFSGFDITEKIKELRQTGLKNVKSVATMIKTNPNSSLEHAKKLLIEANQEKNKPLKNKQDHPPYPELPDEIEEFAPHVERTSYKRAAVTGVVITFSLALFFIFKKDVLKLNKKVSREISSIKAPHIFGDKNNLGKTKFSPLQTFDFKNSYVKNIIYTKDFFKNKNDSRFNRNWQLGLKKYFKDNLQLNEETYVRFLGMETRFLADIKNKSDSLTLENKEQLIEELQLMEHSFRKKSEELMGGQAAYNSYYQQQKGYYQKYFHNSGTASNANSKK